MPTASPPSDDLERHFWLSTARTGGWVTVATVLAAALYEAALATGQARAELGTTLVLAAALGALVLRVAPWQRVVASSAREGWFLTWSLLTVACIAAMAALDGGAASPLAVALVLPVFFASLAYDPVRVRVVAGVAALAFTGLLLVGRAGHGHGPVLGSVLFVAAVMAVSQARFHRTWRAKLSRSSRTDPLTGILNRRGLDDAARAAFAQLDRRGRAVTLLVIDLDLFKSYNDTHGHRAGDALLSWVAAEVSDAVRPTDAVARIGGDEFTVLLPDTTEAGAQPIIRRIGDALQPRIGHSIGCAVAPQDGTSFEELYRAADALLYQGKLLLRTEAGDVDIASSPVERRKRLGPLSADAILAGVTEAFFVLDDQWRFAYVNRAAGAMLEHPAHDLLGRVIWDVFPDAAGSQFEQVYLRVLDTGLAERFIEHYAPLGTTFPVRASPIPGGLSVHFHDVSADVAVLAPGRGSAASAPARTTPGLAS